MGNLLQGVHDTICNLNLSHALASLVVCVYHMVVTSTLIV
jgi:hypothetical protein